MRVVVVTGGSGLVGSETVRYYADRAEKVVGLDNDMRAEFLVPARRPDGVPTAFHPVSAL